MIFDKFPVNDATDARLGRWFLISGGVGVIVAILLAIAMSYNRAPEKLLFTLWPTAILQVVDPHSLAGLIVMLLFVYGGNFLLYGLIGCGIGYLLSRLRLLFNNHS
ncbi:MAG: hypothetical protein ACYCOR_20585 [Acidobacteriaceae bacterium]